MSRRVGRPMKYDVVLRHLKDGVLYSPAAIARLALELGLFPGQEARLIHRKIRHALARYKANHGFPVMGDGMVCIQGQAPMPGWYGKRWKEDLE